ncbi:hypothetical protein AMATHDRAFT_60359 [Amanita thiersii Skay4041]|uniref:Uncharacterized protein n=1 Tax=Amanita thiersii Skay4041 TaxID=703135 RepID=A0A2A9NRB6_9AGAR|nr:hypothetical protein AMATHDRAFT_60359 [Amanita thiersii Skay4041]
MVRNDEEQACEQGMLTMMVEAVVTAKPGAPSSPNIRIDSSLLSNHSIRPFLT